MISMFSIWKLSIMVVAFDLEQEVKFMLDIDDDMR